MKPLTNKPSLLDKGCTEMAVTLNKSAIQLLALILTATDTSGNGFVVPGAPATKALIEAGFIEVNDSIKGGEGGNEVAARITDAGREYAKSGPQDEAGLSGEVITGNGAGDTGAAGNVATPRKRPTFEIEAVPMVAPTRATAPALYPFDELEVGQSFFLADKDTKAGNAYKTLGTSVNGANKRHSEPTGEKRPHRRDASKMVDVVRPLRKFELRHFTQADGTTGARVYRVEVSE